MGSVFLSEFVSFEEKDICVSTEIGTCFIDVIEIWISGQLQITT